MEFNDGEVAEFHYTTSLNPESPVGVEQPKLSLRNLGMPEIQHKSFVRIKV